MLRIHDKREKMTIVHVHFPGQVISRFGDIEWPARSHVFFSVGHLKIIKFTVYCENSTTIDKLKMPIRNEITPIIPDRKAGVMGNMRKRVQIFIASELVLLNLIDLRNSVVPLVFLFINSKKSCSSL